MRLLWMFLTLINVAPAQHLGGFVRLMGETSNGQNVPQNITDVTDSAGTKDFLNFIFNSTDSASTIPTTRLNALLKKLHIEKKVKKRMEERKFKTRLDLEIYLRATKEAIKVKIDGCYPADQLLKIHNISDGAKITREDFVRLGPAILHELESETCWGKKKDDDEHGTPKKAETWGYGFLSITIISFASLALIVIIPCIPKSVYARVMSYLVALAVGTLSGDAVLHLIPHAFGEGANSAIGIHVDEEDEELQEHATIARGLFVLLGIYAFFGVELVMKLRGGGHSHSHGGSHGHSHANGKPRAPSTKSVQYANNEAVEIDVVGGENGETKQPPASNDVIIYQSQRKPSMRDAGEKQKEINRDTSVRTVAWVVIIGDGFHNFTDGLAIGAAFSASLSSGLSTSLAVFCHELPHELGDFAVLLSSGMSWKQAIIYNLVSTTCAYFGLVAGILAGGEEFSRHCILCITGGLFLYVALADLLPELTNEDIPDQSKICTFLTQFAGILTGVAFMLVIALYEDKMGG